MTGSHMLSKLNEVLNTIILEFSLYVITMISIAIAVIDIYHASIPIATCLFLLFSRWKSCAGVWLFGLLCLLYIFQVITLFIFIGNSEEDRNVAVRAILFIK